MQRFMQSEPILSIVKQNHLHSNSIFQIKQTTHQSLD